MEITATYTLTVNSPQFIGIVSGSKNNMDTLGDLTATVSRALEAWLSISKQPPSPGAYLELHDNIYIKVISGKSNISAAISNELTVIGGRGLYLSAQLNLTHNTGSCTFEVYTGSNLTSGYLGLLTLTVV